MSVMVKRRRSDLEGRSSGLYNLDMARVCTFQQSAKPGSELERNRIKHHEKLEGRIMLLRSAGNAKCTIEMDPYRRYLNDVRLWNRWRSRLFPWNRLDQERWRYWRALGVLRGARVLFDSNDVAIIHQPWFNECSLLECSPFNWVGLRTRQPCARNQACVAQSVPAPPRL